MVGVAADWHNDPTTAMRNGAGVTLVHLAHSIFFGEDKRHAEILCRAGKKR